jgi:hypothetical protein
MSPDTLVIHKRLHDCFKRIETWLLVLLDLVFISYNWGTFLKEQYLLQLKMLTD